jgi:hypothetical protein
MRQRASHVDLAGLLLLGWAGLLGYVSLLTGWSFEDPVEGVLLVVGVVFAASQLVAALGVFRRAAWARLLGLIVGGIGLVGTGLVLLTLAANLGAAPDLGAPMSPLVLGIPAAMIAAYVVIEVILYRSRDAFDAASG